jgi:hypothetical protein
MSMADFTPTYTFEDGSVYAIHEGKVIASGTDLESVESEATEYLEAKKQEFKVTEHEKAKKTATHVITPNGVEGEILGRTPSLWGEQVTVRLANGNIHSFVTHGEDGTQWIAKNERTAATKGIVANLRDRLDADFDRDLPGLSKRASELNDIIDTARRHLANGAPYLEEIKLDQIVVAATNEKSEVVAAGEHLADADDQAFQAPSFNPQVVEQADLGRATTDNWLDATVQQMVDESAGQDYEKLMAEGPALFITELETPALADAGVTRELASSYISERTAGYVGDEVDDYRSTWVARAEVARRHELATRKETVHKEAAQVEESVADAPDELLFM